MIDSFFSLRVHGYANVSVGACMMGWWGEHRVDTVWWMSCSCSSLEIAEGRKLLRKGSWPMYYCQLGIPALNPISRKGKIALLPESAGEELSPALVQGCVSIGIFFYMLDWAKIDSTKSPFLCVFKRI